jgi:hypothetical protein
MPVTAISPGPVIQIQSGVIYALPGSPCLITTGAASERANLYAGPFVGWPSTSGAYNHVGGFVKPLSNTWIQARKIKMDGTVDSSGLSQPIVDADASYSAAIMKDRPSYYWNLNEESGLVAADSVGGANGTISGGVVLNQPGAVGKGMLFNGTTGKIVTSINIPIPSIVTYEAWIKQNVTTGFQTFFGIEGYQLIFGAQDGNFCSYWSAGNPINVIGPTISPGWHHVVLIQDRTTAKFYLDGVFHSSTAQTRPVLLGLGGIGSEPNTLGNLFNGTIDEVAIYPYALSPQQISSHYLAKFGITNPSSYAAKVIKSGASNYWKLNESSGLTAVDMAGGANGTLSGGVIQTGDGGMVFNGSSAKIVTAANVPTTQTATYEVWMKTAGSPTGQKEIISTSEPRVVGIVSGTSFIYHNGGAVGIKIINDNQWHHIVYIFKPTSVEFYVDGVFDRSVATTIPVPTSLPVEIGWFSGANSFWPGQIDDVAIYPKALTPAEILDHYQSRPKPYESPAYVDVIKRSGPSNYWRLNETSGLVANDIVGGANGTISGGVTLNGESGMTFNGTTGKINAGNIAGLNFGAGSYTIEALVSPSVSGFQVPVGKGQSPSASGWRAFLHGDNSAQLYWGPDGNFYSVNSTDFCLLNYWNHVIWGYDAISGKAFEAVNGSYIAVLLANHSVTSTDPLTIGGDAAGYPFNGKIKEVAIYPRALTPAEILSHFNSRGL